MSLLLGLVGALAVNRQHATALVGVTKEAEDVARVVSFLLMSDTNKFSASSAQEIVARLHTAQGRDVVLMDSQQRILADSIPSEIGSIFTNDPGDEIGATIKDREVRTFIEVSQAYPAGIKQIVVPVEGESGQVLGAVVVEYTPLYNELMKLTSGTIRQVVLAAVGSLGISLLIAFFMGSSIARPLEQLSKVATQFASGRTDLQLPPSRKDEVGELATAFNDMVQKRQRAEDELQHLHDELEVRVVKRTAELANANEALQAENVERQRGEEALQQNQLRYSSLFENMLDGYAQCRMLFEQEQPHDFIYLEVNSAFEKLTGLKNVVGKKVSEVIPGFREANRELLDLYSRVALTGQPERCETYLEALGIWFSVAAYSPAKEHFVAVFENITERKLAEDTLRESEEKFHLLSDNITDVFWITSPDFKIMHYVSAGYELIWGRSAESLYANPHQWVETILPEERDGVFAVFGTLMGTAPEVSVEYRIARPDGTIRWIHDRGFQVLDAAGKVIRITGIATDITERKRTEGELERKRAQFASLVNSVDGIVWEADATSFQFTFVSERAEHILGFPAAQWLSTPDFWANQIHPADRQEAVHYCVTCTGKKENHTFEYRMLAADGRAVWVRDIVTYVEDPGKPAMLRGIMLDITESKRAEAELEKANKELVKTSRLAGKAEMATGVLHNVGNVLNSVTVASSCMASSLKQSKAANLSKVVTMLREHETDLGGFLTSDPKGKRLPAYLAHLADQLAVEQSVALKELAQLQKNIEHIKEVVGLQQVCAKGVGKVQTLQVTDLVEDTLRMDSGGDTSRDIQVIKEFEAAPFITVEKHKVLQILMNLVRNAKQSCHEAGGANQQLTLRVTNGDDRVRIAVSDNGVGISSENLARIFSHGFTTKQDGHGFGLHSAMESAKGMAGELRVHSDGVGRGATFTLELPVSANSNHAN